MIDSEHATSSDGLADRVWVGTSRRAIKFGAILHSVWDRVAHTHHYAKTVKSGIQQAGVDTKRLNEQPALTKTANVGGAEPAGPRSDSIIPLLPPSCLSQRNDCD